MGRADGAIAIPERLRTVGIDLSGMEKNPSGWAILEGRKARTALLSSDEEIVEATVREEPDLVAIDAPLSLPENGYTREVDKAMHKLGLHVLPPLFPAMKALTLRGIKLSDILLSRGLSVIEVHPASTRKVLGLPVKGRASIRAALLELGLRGDLERRELSIHELDALTAALTASLHLLGLSEPVRARDGEIIIPRRDLKIEVTR